jgi:predicted CoA-substrate-specific enzyme activase
MLEDFDWEGIAGAAVTGRFSRHLNLQRIPIKQAQSAGFRFLHDGDPATVVSVGSHGFSVLELRDSGVEMFRENTRCSQGTGNFLRQLVERFDLDLEQANELCESVTQAAALSGRCPVILKTDMTHLANKGEDRSRILAGLYDAVCENVQVLIKPNVTPRRLMLAGGVTRSLRIREHFASYANRHGIDVMDYHPEHALLLEAIGAASLARDYAGEVPALCDLFAAAEEHELDRVPQLSHFLPQIRRMPSKPRPKTASAKTRMILGFDIGSTGSKAVLLDAERREMLWESYRSTSGNPVAAAQALMQSFCDSPWSKYPLVALGVTGSGREVVGSLMSTCYGVEHVYILNEIAAHAEGALYFDPRVDTIFEIGGQDAKYIRLAEGRVIDAAMNEACSAGTGSFIEEQGRKFEGIRDVVQLGEEAITADYGVSLGQHCSVFMAEIIDEAVASGVEKRAIIAGIYDSIIQNYLNRVKGSRSVGQVIFCQGMPFSSDALAAAVAHQTGSEVVIPPNPGTVGALGIALLAQKAMNWLKISTLEPHRFLLAQVVSKESFACKSKQGCGEPGNFCRIDRLRTLVEGQSQNFTWGGGCSLWDKGTGKRKLPDLAPDPFRQREELIADLIASMSASRERKTIALTDEFQLKSMLPFFATFLHGLGFDLVFATNADQQALKRGIEEANVPFCAPMQQYHGLVSMMTELGADYLFMPMIRSIQRVRSEPNATLCPIVQASTDMLRNDLGPIRSEIISPVIDIGDENLQSQELMESCRVLASQLGIVDMRWWDVFVDAQKAQSEFEAACQILGQQALDFCAAHQITPIIVLGREYTIYNKVLNSNVPTILREQGAIAIPIDCYPVSEQVPTFNSVFWGYGQRNLRAAHQIRRTPGIYSIWCSNYACGPDSFNIHFYSYIMEGKPFAIIETDGHSGDAGTKTRVEAFLHCVREDLTGVRNDALMRDFDVLDRDNALMPDILAKREKVLFPRMGPGAEVAAACLRGVGVDAESLPVPDRDSVRIGRRYTSGKECVPMCITLGSLIQRIEAENNPDQRFAFFMPRANGPCRFGVYNLLHKITVERLGWKDRIRVWSPSDKNYFESVPASTTVVIFAGFVAADFLLNGLYTARPAEMTQGAAQEIYDRYHHALLQQLEQVGGKKLSFPTALMQVVSGQMFGCVEILRQAAKDYASIMRDRQMPTVSVVGEIYVRCDPFANDYVIDRLEQRGIRAYLAPFTEWLEYVDYLNHFVPNNGNSFSKHLTTMIQQRVMSRMFGVMSKALGWPPRTTVKDSLAAAEGYLRQDLQGEAVLTIGGPLHEWRHGAIDGVVSVGPLECMPNKIAEAQFYHIAEREGLPSLTLSLNGDPVDPEIIDNFAFEVHTSHRNKLKQHTHQTSNFSNAMIRLFEKFRN